MKIEDNKLVVDDNSYTINEEGNAITETGEVFKTKDEIEKGITPVEDSSKGDDNTPQEFIEGNEVEIDDKVYVLNDKGDAVDSEGRVFKTKAEIEELVKLSKEETKDEDNKISIPVEDVLKETQISIVSEEGNPVTFENTKEGLISLVRSTYEQGARDHSEKALRDLYNVHPQLKDIVNHLEIHNSIDGYSDNTSFMNLKLDPENENQLISIIRKEGELKGDSESRIQSLISYAKADGKLHDLAKDSLQFIQGRISQEVSNKEKLASEIKANKAKEQEETYKEITKIIKEGSFKVNDVEVKIPVNIPVVENGKKVIKTKDDFIDYIYKPRPIKLEDGRVITATGYQIDAYKEQQKLGINKELYDALRLFSKQGLDSLLNSTLNTQKANDLKARIKLSTKRSSTSGGNRSTDNIGKIIPPVVSKIKKRD